VTFLSAHYRFNQFNAQEFVDEDRAAAKRKARQPEPGKPKVFVVPAALPSTRFCTTGTTTIDASAAEGAASHGRSPVCLIMRLLDNCVNNQNLTFSVVIH
jgi:hypothetical protein